MGMTVNGARSFEQTLNHISTKDQCEIWWLLAKWFLKNHDFIHVNSTVAGKYNKHKQDGGHLGFPIRTILATVNLQVTSILLMNFESIALLVQEKKFKIDFQDGRHCRLLGFPTGTVWAICDLQIIPMLPTKFRVNWPFSSGEEAKHRCPTWLPSWISGRNDFSYFWSTSHPDASYQFLSQLALCFRKWSKKQSFKMAVIIFDFRPDRFKLFLIYKSPQCFLPSLSQLAFLFMRRSEKQIFKMANTAAILDFRSEQF